MKKKLGEPWKCDISNDVVREWYENHFDNFARRVFDKLPLTPEHARYSLDPESGLFFRNVLQPGHMDILGFTLLDIIFPRPTDFHYHKDVQEAIRVLRGKGELITKLGSLKSYPLSPGTDHFFSAGETHSFRPNKNSFLEIRLACSGILDPEQEVCVEKFNEFKPWVEYFE